MSDKKKVTKYNHSCAGVVVYNDNKEVVVVATPKGNYSFPKGKKKKGETVKQTALRELYEETGIDETEIEFHLIFN